MDWKLFAGTFALIFLAELGDKTQLAALARSATGDKWTVFAAASLALVCSTLIAVLIGSALTRVIPPVAIKLASGALFIVFGLLIVWNAFRPAPEPRADVPETGLLARIALDMAAEFEAAAEADYAALAAACEDAELRRLLLALGAEEAEHARRLGTAQNHHGEVMIPELDTAALPDADRLNADVAGQAQPIIAHAIEHEQATADFYAELARTSVIPALRHTFAALAEEERSHVRRLRVWADHTG